MEKRKLNRRDFIKLAAAAAGGVALLGGAGVLANRLGTEGLVQAAFPSPDSFLPAVFNNSPTPTTGVVPTSAPKPTGLNNMIFLHRSVGDGMLNADRGDLRAKLTAKGYELWDYFAMPQNLGGGLKGPNGERIDAVVFPLQGDPEHPNDLTDPEDLGVYFKEPYDPDSDPGYPSSPVNTLTGLLRHEIIMIKSCYTAVEHLTSDKFFNISKAGLLAIREVAWEQDKKLFLLLTPPPSTLNYDGNANRGRKFADWMMSGELQAGAGNLFVFDLFSRLADSRNELRQEYREPSGSHPSESAWKNTTIISELIDFIDQSVRGA